MSRKIGVIGIGDSRYIEPKNLSNVAESININDISNIKDMYDTLYIGNILNFVKKQLIPDFIKKLSTITKHIIVVMPNDYCIAKDFVYGNISSSKFQELIMDKNIFIYTDLIKIITQSGFKLSKSSLQNKEIYAEFII
jgi:RNA recognition motif-containing protein